MIDLRKNIIIHVCCSPCLTYTYEQLTKNEYNITGFFYNPNIHPYTEYKKRLESLEKYASIMNINMIYKDEYDIKTYLKKSISSKDRCKFCYIYRLTETAKLGKKLKYKEFTTTLLISPYQRHDLILELGIKIGKKYGIKFYYEDFRKGYKKSRNLARKYNLYLQQYCGCIFSEKERYDTYERN